ncbi:MAG: hypothetical protein ABI045_04685 [Flavobacteriales bacterium]
MVDDLPRSVGVAPSRLVRCSVIGRAVLFPILSQHLEDLSLTALAVKKYFQVYYLYEFPDEDYFIEQKLVTIKSVGRPSHEFHFERGYFITPL